MVMHDFNPFITFPPLFPYSALSIHVQLNADAHEQRLNELHQINHQYRHSFRSTTELQ